jgi:flagellar biosynthesis GTPase FlhF
MADDGYEVKRGIIGKPKVAYKCAKCHNDLESDLTDAGKKDTCPFCKAAFIVPGQRELNEIQDAAKQAEAEKTRKDEERRAAKAESVRQREEWLRLQEEERTRRDVEQRQRQERNEAAFESVRQREEREEREERERALLADSPLEPFEPVSVLLWVLFAFGFVWTCYFFWGYETSIPTADYSYAERVQNVGLLAHQQQGVIIGIGLVVFSTIFIAERRIRRAIINPAVRQATHDLPLKPMKPLF